MNGTVLVVFTVACAVVVLAMAALMAKRIRRVTRSGQRDSTLTRVQAFVMGGAVVLMVVLNGLSLLRP